MKPKTVQPLAVPTALQDSEHGLRARYADYGAPTDTHEGGSYVELLPFDSDEPVFLEECDDVTHALAILAELTEEDVA